MQQKQFPQAEKYTRQNRRRRAWQRIVSVLGCIVVFCTTYALILPAITLEKTLICDETHIHDDSCYAQMELNCYFGVHAHDETCYDSTGALACGMADYVIHKHNEYCFDSDNNLVCTLAEVEAHQHDENCYASEEEAEQETQASETPQSTESSEATQAPHTHEEACYTAQRGEQTCTLEEVAAHTHTTESCYSLPLVCGLEETEGHTHTTENCFGPVLSCGLEVTEGHTHTTENCYGSVLVCTTEETSGHTHTTESCYSPVLSCTTAETAGHSHTDTCYGEDGALVCGQEEVPAHSHGDGCYTSQLTCTAAECAPHTHGDGCYSTGLTCTSAEYQAHSHDDTCYTEGLVCTTPECEAHAHADTCYGTEPVLTCTLEETEGHTHTDECFVMEDVLTCGYEESGEVSMDTSVSGATGNDTPTEPKAVETEPTDPTAQTDPTEPTEPEPLCGKEEVIEHIHDEPCYDENGNLICGMLELFAHDHTADCWAPVATYATRAGTTVTAQYFDGIQYNDVTLTFEEGVLPDNVSNITVNISFTYLGAETKDDVPPALDANLGNLIETQLDELGQIRYYQLTLSCTYVNENNETVTVTPKTAVIPYTFTNAPFGNPEIYTYDMYQTVTTQNGEGSTVYSLQKLNTNQTTAESHDNTGTKLVAFEVTMVSFDEDGTTVVALPEQFVECQQEDCTLEDALTWRGSSAVNPFGGAVDYNLFLFGNLEEWNDVEGNVALQGNLVAKNGGMTYPEGATNTSTGDAIPHFDVGLLLGGGFEGGLQAAAVANGSVISAHDLAAEGYIRFGARQYEGDHFHPATTEAIQNYFKAAYADLSARNSSIAGMTSNGTVTAQTDGSLILTGTDQFENVFTLTAEQYAALGESPRSVYLDVPYGSYVIINVAGSGTIDSFAPQLWTKNASGKWVDPSDNTNNDHAQSQRILWNFNPAITQVNLNTGFYLYGSILAPNMHWNVNGVYVGVDGTAVLKSADGNGTASEFHYNPYRAPGGASFTKVAMLNSTDENGNVTSATLSIPEAVWVKVKLEEVVDKDGSHAVYELEFPANGTGNAARVSPGYYRVHEVAFYTKNDDGSTTPYTFPGQDISFDGFTCVNPLSRAARTGVTIIYIPSGGTMQLQIVNNYVPGAFANVEFSKIWKDTSGNTVYAPTGTKVKVMLYRTTDKNADPASDPAGTPYDDVEIELTASTTGWGYSWTHLPRVDEYNNKYYYYVKEIGVFDKDGNELVGYDTVYPTPGVIESGSYTITNQQAMQVSVRKIWKDHKGSTIDAPEGKTVQVTLYQTVNGAESVVTKDRHGNDVVSTVTLGTSEGSIGKWYYTWGDLPDTKTNEDGTSSEITYSVKETIGVDGYISTITQPEPSTYSFIITNTRNPAWEVSVRKKWQDASGNTITGSSAIRADLYRYESVYNTGTVSVTTDLGTGELIESQWLSNINGWSYTWTNLPLNNGSEDPASLRYYYYKVVEGSNIAGYSSTAATTWDKESYTSTTEIINKRQAPPAETPDTTSVSVLKQWQDIQGNYVDGPENTDVQVQLYQKVGTKQASGEAYTVTLDFLGTTKTYQVVAGSSFEYTIDFYHHGSATTVDGLFKTSPSGTLTLSDKLEIEGWPHEYISLDEYGWIYKAQISGKVDNIQSEIILKFESNAISETDERSLIFVGEARQMKLTYEVSEPSYTAPTYTYTWNSTSLYSVVDQATNESKDTFPLNSGNNWYYQWSNLPKEETVDGTTYVYRYFVKEVGGEGYDKIYLIGGTSYDLPDKSNGIESGDLVIINRANTVPGYELPSTGGTGTQMYTMAGMVLMCFAGCLLYFHISGKKGGKHRA